MQTLSWYRYVNSRHWQYKYILFEVMPQQQSECGSRRRKIKEVDKDVIDIACEIKTVARFDNNNGGDEVSLEKLGTLEKVFI